MARQAAAANSRWASLAAAMMSEVELPVNGLTPGELETARADLHAIGSTCDPMGFLISGDLANPLTEVLGTQTGRGYAVRIWAEDMITDCSEHSYGARVIAFFSAHPCSQARRVLATLNLDDKTVALSVVTVEIPAQTTASNDYRNAGQFMALENANGTGSISDLLREGHRIPGVGAQIPANETFLVIGQDDGASVFDAWYVRGATAANDTRLLALEHDLFLTRLTTL